METKEIKITPPEGYEIDKENSTFEKIVFKKVGPKRFIDNEKYTGVAYFINCSSDVVRDENVHLNYRGNHCGFATRAMAESAIAMARISQIIANDDRFGGFITNEEWGKCEKRFVIRVSFCSSIPKFCISSYYGLKTFLAFHTKAQAELFVKENLELLKQYFMVNNNDEIKFKV